MAAIRKLWGTRHKLRILAIIFGVAMIYVLPFLAVPGMAAIYLKIDGIDGESISKGHEKWIVLDSVQFGVSRPVSSVGGGGETGMPSASEIVITKKSDRTTPLLFNEAVMGEAKGATLHFTKLNTSTGIESTFYEVTLTDVLVSGFSQSGSSDVPSESVSLNYGVIALKYNQLDSKGGTIGSTTGGFNFKTMTK